MLKFFGAGHLSRYVAIFLLLVLFWTPAFINPQNYYLYADTPFAKLAELVEVNIYFSTILAFIIIVISALLLNQLATDYEFSSRYSSLGMFFLVILTSSLPAFYSFNPIILANVFILFLLKNICELPTSELTIPIVFNSGLLIGFASLFFPPLVLLLFFLWGALFTHRISTWRNIVASMIGILMPYLFVFTWYLWTESIVENSNQIFENYFYIPDFSLAGFSIEIQIITFILLLIIYSTFSTLGHLREKNINLRRNLMISIIFLLFSIAIAWFYFKIPQTLLLVASPAALLLTNVTFQRKKLKWFNIIIYSLLALIVANLYFNLLF